MSISSIIGSSSFTSGDYTTQISSEAETASALLSEDDLDSQEPAKEALQAADTSHPYEGTSLETTQLGRFKAGSSGKHFVRQIVSV